MPRINSLLRLLHNNAIQVIPSVPKALAVMQPVQKAVLVPAPVVDSVVVYLSEQAQAPPERHDMPRPDALAIALLEQYPNHS